MTKGDKEEMDKLLSLMTAKGRGETVQSKKPEDAEAAYVWRMIRYYTGKDIKSPNQCYFDLHDQNNNFLPHGIWGDADHLIVDKLDYFVDEIMTHLGYVRLTRTEILRMKATSKLAWYIGGYRR